MEYLFYVGTSYVMYFFTTCCIFKEEYLEKKKNTKIKKQYNNLKIDFDIEMH